MNNLPISPSLRALLAGSIDYAGLFPPANLPLAPALDNYAAYARGEHAWMLARFVLPVARFNELGPLLAGRFDLANPLRVSALGAKTASAGGFFEALRAGLAELISFRELHGIVVAIDLFEAPLPPESLSPAPALRALLTQTTELIETLMPSPLRAFWEVPFTDDLPAIFQNIADHNAALPRTSRCRPFGVKLRTGGTEAGAFPTPAALARALVAARDAGVALKFTAGLHHPIRRFYPGVGAKMHGFLNVYAAGLLARELAFDADMVAVILDDERPDIFLFDDESFWWRDQRVPRARLTHHRAMLTTFGACSFDEPRDDLRALGWL